MTPKRVPNIPIMHHFWSVLYDNLLNFPSVKKHRIYHDIILYRVGYIRCIFHIVHLSKPINNCKIRPKRVISQTQYSVKMQHHQIQHGGVATEFFISLSQHTQNLIFSSTLPSPSRSARSSSGSLAHCHDSSLLA